MRSESGAAEGLAGGAIKSHIMYALRSKYSIRLYETVERRIGLMKQHEEFTFEQFRAMFGVPDGKLERFADPCQIKRPKPAAVVQPEGIKGPHVAPAGGTQSRP